MQLVDARNVFELVVSPDVKKFVDAAEDKRSFTLPDLTTVLDNGRAYDTRTGKSLGNRYHPER